MKLKEKAKSCFVIVPQDLKVKIALSSVVTFTDRASSHQRGILLHAAGQQSSAKLFPAKVLRLDDGQGAAASHRSEPAPAASGFETLHLAQPALPGGLVPKLPAAAAPRPGALRVGGPPVPAQPGRPLRGAAVGRPHCLPPAQG